MYRFGGGLVNELSNPQQCSRIYRSTIENRDWIPALVRFRGNVRSLRYESRLPKSNEAQGAFKIETMYPPSVAG